MPLFDIVLLVRVMYKNEYKWVNYAQECMRYEHL